MVSKRISWRFIKLAFFLGVYSFYHNLSFANLYDVNIVSDYGPGETTTDEKEVLGGVGGEILIEAFAAAGLKFRTTWLPWKRAQTATTENSDRKSFIFPLTRNIERESKYNWTVKLYSEKTVFISHASKDKINSIIEAKNKKIAVLFASSFLTTLEQHKDIDLVKIPNGDEAVKLLKDRNSNVDGWYSGQLGAVTILKAHGEDVADYNIGETIEREDIYLATSKDAPRAIVSRVSRAIEDFKKAEKYKEIMIKYFGNSGE